VCDLYFSALFVFYLNFDGRVMFLAEVAREYFGGLLRRISCRREIPLVFEYFPFLFLV
jgi:hypothetical protein